MSMVVVKDSPPAVVMLIGVEPSAFTVNVPPDGRFVGAPAPT